MKSFYSILTLLFVTFALGVNAAPALAERDDIVVRRPGGRDWRREPSN